MQTKKENKDPNRDTNGRKEFIQYGREHRIQSSSFPFVHLFGISVIFRILYRVEYAGLNHE